MLIIRQGVAGHNAAEHKVGPFKAWCARGREEGQKGEEQKVREHPTRSDLIMADQDREQKIVGTSSRRTLIFIAAWSRA